MGQPSNSTQKHLMKAKNFLKGEDIVESVRVVLADDHAGVRGMVREILQAVPGIEVVGEASNGLETIEKVRECKPDVLVLDMEMPFMNGVQVTRHLMEAGSTVRILALSAYDDHNYIEGALENGASGYLLKDDLPGNLSDVIRGVAAGKKGWISADLAQSKNNSS